MRKLTVKNFSVIKEAELEFGKITVLIGPQSSGKSLLSKLAYFLGTHTINEALDSVINGELLDQFRLKLLRKLLDWFPIETWKEEDTFVKFECGEFFAEARVVSIAEGSTAEFRFSPRFEEVFLELRGLAGVAGGLSSEFSSDRREQIRGRFNLLLTASSAGHPFVYQSLYIPSGRTFFSNLSLGFSALQNTNIDPLVREFAPKIAWGEAWKPNPILGNPAIERLDLIRRDMDSLAGGYIEGRNTNALFRRFSDGRKIPLTLLSSGTQELLPLLNVLQQIITSQRDRVLYPRSNSLPGLPNYPVASKGLIYLEEPEANVFPSTQYDLIRLFASLSSEQVLDFSWVITTHSPYILSSFNNLLEAWQAGHTDEQRAEAVRAVIEENYWVNPDEFWAYAIDDGYLKSIMDEETHLISDNFLDSVSERIGGEFDDLLRIGYVQA